MFEQYTEKIEDNYFQVQFIALAGYSVLELVLQSHEYVRTLITGLNRGELQLEEVYDRILYLLPKVATEQDESFDGSIVVYLYCLSRFDLELAYDASVQTKGIVGLFWSRQLARRVEKLYLDTQIMDGEIHSFGAVREAFVYGKLPHLVRVESTFAVSKYKTNLSRRYLRIPIDSDMVARAAS